MPGVDDHDSKGRDPDPKRVVERRSTPGPRARITGADQEFVDIRAQGAIDDIMLCRSDALEQPPMINRQVLPREFSERLSVPQSPWLKLSALRFL
jgi:hypothetical protein